MKDGSLDVIVGLMAGLEAAIVHLVKALDEKGVLSKEQMSRSFAANGLAVLPSVKNRELIALVMKHLAEGLDDAQPSDKGQVEIRRLLH